MEVEIINWEKLSGFGVEIPGGINAFTQFYESVFNDVKKKVNIVFVDQAEIRELNMKFRQKDVATDVLSFNIDSEDVLGEVYVSLDYLKSEGRLDTHEILRMIVHGTLHLMGMDHEGYFDYDGVSKEPMFVEQEKRLAELLSYFGEANKKWS